jgi:outer membrane protein
MKSKNRALGLMFTTACLGLACISNVQAHDAGDWLLRFGATNIDPKSNNHEIARVEDATGVTFNLSYMMTANWSVELLAALPYKHDIKLVGGGKVASTKHLPPTLSLQYHFMPQSSFQPYIGAGLNYTTFFSEHTKGALQGTDLSLGDSWGWAAEAGADIKLNDKWFLNLDIRYIEIETKAKLDGASIGKVKISPMVYGAHIGVRF